MLISLSFSVVIYELISFEVERFASMQRTRIERRFREGLPPPGTNFLDDPFNLPIVDPDLLSETKHRLLLMLIEINGTILIISGGLGYFLAGRTLRPIKEMIDEQNHFISDSSHELRTPLTSLKSSMEVNLRDKNLTIKDARKLIFENIDEVNKLQSLSDQLLQLAQFQKPNGYTKFEKLALSEIVQSAIKKVEPIAKQKNIEIQNETQKIDIEGNKYGLMDLLVILLDNAIKYSPEKKLITVSSHKTDGSIELSVKDEGIGIEGKDLPHIFDRFYRADTVRLKIEAGGYGLGLSIAKKIIDVHHGSIFVKSKINEGSTFVVRLPIRQRTNTDIVGKLKPSFFS